MNFISVFSFSIRWAISIVLVVAPFATPLASPLASPIAIPSFLPISIPLGLLNESKDLKIGQKVNVSTKAFAPTIG